MNPIDIRDHNWHSLRNQLAGSRKTVYEAWVRFGPATTRSLAGYTGIDILNIRPRTTELVEAGLVECCGVESGQGLYRVRSQAEWEAWRSTHLSIVGQLQLI